MTENNTNSNRNSNSNNIHNDNNRVDNRVDNYDHTESFYIPLMYQENLNKLDRHVSEDLELNTLYSNLYFPNEEDASQTFTLDKYKNDIIEQYTNHYTTDLELNIDVSGSEKMYELNDLHDKWILYNNSEFNFKDHFYYLEWNHLDFLNTNTAFLLYMSVMNMLSPIITLVIPILFMIIPLIFIRFVFKQSISIHDYKKLILMNLNKHVIGNFVHHMSTPGNYDKKITSVGMILAYCWSTYQNILQAIRYYANLKEMKDYLNKLKLHLQTSLQYISSLERNLNFSQYFKGFLNTCREKKDKCEHIISTLNCLDNKSFSLWNTFKIGKYMKCFYNINTCNTTRQLLSYTFGLHSYIHSLQHIKRRIVNRSINPCKFFNKHNKKGESPQLKQQYYLSYVDRCSEEIKKNTVYINKNYILTGPNASGKTTIIKTSFINLLLSQQIGYGCYSKHTLVHPYDLFSSYLNIPDTSNRDSLFQAEARRCLNIIHQLHDKPDKRTFIIFDELYSGTNPNEAVVSAIAILNYLVKHNMNFMVTTHYTDICNSDHLSPRINNYMMETTTDASNNLSYTYKMKKGISYVHGGCKILFDMEYPVHILDTINHVNKSRFIKKKSIK
jgi:hypothetical protein